MVSPLASPCLTRWVTDDDIAVEIAHLHKVMMRIQSALRDIPNAERSYVANTLLNLAVTKVGKKRLAVSG